MGDGLMLADVGHNQAFVKEAKYRAYGRKQSRLPIPPKPPGSPPRRRAKDGG
jgi:hypothetical protein